MLFLCAGCAAVGWPLWTAGRGATGRAWRAAGPLTTTMPVLGLGIIFCLMSPTSAEWSRLLTSQHQWSPLPSFVTTYRSSVMRIPAGGLRSSSRNNIRAFPVQLPRASADSSVESLQATVSKVITNRVLSGIEPTPDLMAILVVYFVQGAIGLSRLATSFYLKDDLGLAPAQLAALTGLFSFPWLIKPLYGFLSDGFPIAGYKRRSYLALAGLLGAFAWGALSSPLVVDGPVKAAVACTLSSLSIAVSDVVADSLVVERVREDGKEDPTIAAGLQSLCWGSSAVGGILSAYFSGYLLEKLGTRAVFGLTALFPLLVTALAVGAMTEEKTTAPFSWDGAQSVATEQAAKLWEALRRPSVYLPLLFLFVWQATPTSDSAFFYFLTNDVGLKPEFLGRVRLGTSIASLVGVWAYQRFLKDVPIPKVLLWTTVASVPLGLSQLVLVYHLNAAAGIPDELFAFGDSVILTVLGQLAFMPTLVLAAKLCPPGVEGSLFATLMSVYNAAGALGSELGALLTSALGVTERNFQNLGLLVLLCNLSSLISLPLLGLLGKAEDTEGSTEGREEQESSR